MNKVPIPECLQHLKLDPRGYPIPFFVAMIDGKPDFRLLDSNKQKLCLEKKLCEVCGKKLFSDYHYYISGPIGFSNRISGDPGMHRDCAEYSLKVCPHLYLEKSERREKGDVYQHAKATDMTTIAEKPSEVFLIKASGGFNYFPSPDGHGMLIRYRAVGYDKYTYENGVLAFHSTTKL